MSKKKKRMPLPVMREGISVIDSHCHLDMGAYSGDCAAVVERASAAGVEYIMTIGIDLASSEAALGLARRFSGVFCSVGVHPHNVLGVNDEQYSKIAALSREPEVRAYGEIGLDYVKDYAPKKEQIVHFERQVQLGKELGLPLIIHDREAHDDVMAILKNAAPFPDGGVMHCYSGDADLAAEILKLGFYLSIPGVVTFKKADTLKETVRHMPLSSLLIETDGPFLAPAPYRGKRNEPAYLLYTALEVARLKELSLEEVAWQTTENCKKLFGL